jgi:hypothetical protein
MTTRQNCLRLGPKKQEGRITTQSLTQYDPSVLICVPFLQLSPTPACVAAPFAAR